MKINFLHDVALTRSSTIGLPVTVTLAITADVRLGDGRPDPCEIIDFDVRNLAGESVSDEQLGETALSEIEEACFARACDMLGDCE